MYKRLSVLFFLWLILINPLFCKTLHWNKGRGYDPFSYGGYEGIIIDNESDSLRYDYYPLEVSSEDFTLNFRAKNINGHPAKKYPYSDRTGKKFNIGNPYWGFFITCLRDTIAVNIKRKEEITANESVPALELSSYNLFSLEKKSVSITDGINPYDGDNLWSITIKKGILDIKGGNRELKDLLETKCISPVTGFGFFASWGDCVKISDISVNYPFIENISRKDFSKESLDQYLKESTDPLEGYWILFDRELEENLLKFGGNYILASVKDGEGYNLIYLDGAVVNSQNWNPGDVKAILTPSPFEGLFNVEWIDSMKESMKNDIKAQRGEGNTMTFQFPYQSSKFRIRKMSI